MLKPLQDSLGYLFGQPALLTQALTHRSYGIPHNERLEFLGDAVLGCVVAELLYERFAGVPEGDLSRIRAHLVRMEELSSLAASLSLGTYIRLGDGEIKSGGLDRPSIRADVLEAIFGAVYLDGGFEQVRALIRRLYEPALVSLNPQTFGKDAKTRLQEWLQGRRQPVPTYELIATHGAAHQQQFEVLCRIPCLELAVRGEGPSRRAAEQQAASRVLVLIESDATSRRSA